MKKIFRLIAHPLTLFSVWTMFISTYAAGLLRYRNILAGNETESFQVVLSGMWRSSSVFAGVFLCILFVWLYLYLRAGLGLKNKIVFFGVGLSALPILLVSGYLIKLEDRNYNNYLYTQYGLTKGSLELVSNISLLLCFLVIAFVIYEWRLKNGSKRLATEVVEVGNLHLSWRQITALPFLALLVWYSLSPFLQARGFLSYVEFSYAKQFENFDEITTLNNLVPTDAKIILPPQSSTWPAISNIPITRYFLHPRILVSSSYVVSQESANVLKTAYFIVLSKGETSWPVIKEDEKLISFIPGVSVSFRSLAIIGNEKFVYKIEFLP